MLLRQFISASNAIEEIYIVKREDESDSEESPPVTKLLPENETVPASMTMTSTVPGPGRELVEADEPVEIKSEPEDDEQKDDDGENLVKTEAEESSGDNNLETVVDPNSLLVVEEKSKEVDEDDIPLAVRLKNLKQAKASTRKRKALSSIKKSSSESDYSDDYHDNGNDDDDDGEAKRSQKEPICNICVVHSNNGPINFPSRNELKEHLRAQHSKMLPFHCDKCVSGELKSVCSLNRHFEMHDPSKPYKCCYCEGRFPTRIHRTAHQRRFHKADLENDTIRNANRRFICRYCNKRFAAKFNLERHERNHEMKITDDETFLNRRNKCFLCELKPCETKDELNEHLSVHVDQLPYTCLKCTEPVIITSIRLLNKHLASHEEPEKPIKCIYCDERFISVVGCQAHERTHVQEKEADEVAVAKMEAERISNKIVIVDGMKRYECGYCGNTYSLLSTLRRHENIHTGRVQYICKTCGKIFNKSSCLLQHERTHSQSTPYKCEICGRGFKETIRLIEHRRIHSGERPFTCNVCFKSFRIKPLLKEHSLQCTVPELKMECKCRFCPSIFPCYRELSDHILNNHPLVIEETQCEFCDLKFKDSIQLAEHEHHHRNPNSIKCDICGRIFKQLSNLRRHQRLHSEDAVPYQCDLCGKNFSQAGALKVHKRIHSGEKPYKCDLCDKTFYHSSTMNRHKRSHYKSQSKLFLFGAESAAAVSLEEEASAAVEIDIKSIEIDITPTIVDIRTIEPDSMLNLESDVLIPKPVATHHLITLPPAPTPTPSSSSPQVPNNIHHQQHHHQQQLPLPSFEIAAAGTSALYELDSKLLIPQTIMQHQDEPVASAETVTTVTTIEPDGSIAGSWNVATVKEISFN